MRRAFSTFKTPIFLTRIAGEEVGVFEPGFEVLEFGDVRHEHEYKVWRR
jgi:hypothetical protein